MNEAGEGRFFRYSFLSGKEKSASKNQQSTKHIWVKMCYVFSNEWLEVSLYKNTGPYNFLWEYFIQTLPTDTQQSIVQCFQYTQCKEKTKKQAFIRVIICHLIPYWAVFCWIVPGCFHFHHIWVLVESKLHSFYPTFLGVPEGISHLGAIVPSTGHYCFL